MLLNTVSVLVLALIALTYSSARLVKVINNTSRFFKFPKFFLSFIVLGIGTTLPDMFIAGFAASSGNIGLVVGSVIGANIVVLCLIMGLMAIAKNPFKMRERTILENFGWIFLVLMIPLFLIAGNHLTFFEGLILIVVYLMYLYNVHQQESLVKKDSWVQTELIFGDAEKRVSYYGKGVKMEVARGLLLLFVLLISANLVQENAIQVGKDLNVPETFIGVTLVAIGVTLPELVLDLQALKAREEEIIWGDMIGSFIAELTLVLGIAGVFSKGGMGLFNFAEVELSYLFMFISFLLLFFFTYQKKELTKNEGIALILLYVVFMLIQINTILFGK